jgi:hypothetical protein
VIEERLWRDRLGSPARGPSFSDLGFAGYHALAGGAALPLWATGVTVVAIFAAAWLWRQLVRETGSLSVAVAAHLAADAAVMAVLALRTG